MAGPSMRLCLHLERLPGLGPEHLLGGLHRVGAGLTVLTGIPCVLAPSAVSPPGDRGVTYTCCWDRSRVHVTIGYQCGPQNLKAENVQEILHMGISGF